MSSFKLKSAQSLKCTRCPVNKAFEETVQDLKFGYQVYRVKGYVKWEAGSASATYAQIALRRLNLQSTEPWKQPVRLVLAEFPSNPRSTDLTQFEFELTGEEELNAFWNPGKRGRYMFSQNHIPKRDSPVSPNLANTQAIRWFCSTPYSDPMARNSKFLNWSLTCILER